MKEIRFSIFEDPLVVMSKIYQAFSLMLYLITGGINMLVPSRGNCRDLKQMIKPVVSGAQLKGSGTVYIGRCRLS